MARIQTYETDSVLTGAEKVIGTDVPDSNKTKNYLLSDIRDYIASTIQGFEQNNIVVTIPVQAVSGVSYDLAAKINSGEIDWEYSAIAGNNGQIEILDTWNLLFRVPVVSANGNESFLYFDYYLLTHQGKGTIGLSSGVTLTEDNFIRLPSSNYTALPTTDNTLGAPTVYTISAEDITNPEQVLNAQSSPYIIDNSSSDFYFLMQESGIASGEVQTDYACYRFVGANGTYGNGGVGSTAVPSDFVLVDISETETTANTVKNPRIRRVVIPEVVAPTGDTVLAALLRSDLDPINHVSGELLLFEIVHRRNDSGNKYYFEVVGYYWAGALGLVNGGAETVDGDFVFDYSYRLNDTITPSVPAEISANVILTADSSIPEDAVNNSSDTYNLDGSKDFVILAYDNDTSANEYRVYQFTGAVTGNGTYGNGGANTAVNGDFTEITKKSPEDQQVVLLDEDDMVSDSADAGATQQSIKAYVDANAGGSTWVKVPVSSAEILQLQSSPKTLIVAGGADTIIKVKSAFYTYTFGTTPYATATLPDITYDNAQIIATSQINIGGGGSREFRDIALDAPTGGASIANQGVILSEFSDPTAGDGTLTVWLEYQIFDVS